MHRKILIIRIVIDETHSFFKCSVERALSVSLSDPPCKDLIKNIEETKVFFDSKNVCFFEFLRCLYINLDCLFVCFYPINVKTAEPIGPKFFVAPRVIPGKVYE